MLTFSPKVLVAPQAGNQSTKSTGQVFGQPVPKKVGSLLGIKLAATQIKEETKASNSVKRALLNMQQFTSPYSAGLKSAPKC